MENLYFLLFVILLGNNFWSDMVEALEAQKIIGGQEVNNLRQFKYVVAVMYVTRVVDLPVQYACTGTIVGNSYVITVAHCFYNKTTGIYNHNEYYITTAVIDINNLTFMSECVRVDLVIMPDNYDPLSSDTYSTAGNLAIIKLAAELNLCRGHSSMRKLKIARDPVKNTNKEYVVTGFGSHELINSTDEDTYLIDYEQQGKTDGKMRFANANVLEDNDCQAVIRDKLAEGNMCAKIIQSPNDRKGICEGDSGSPLVYGRYLTGIAINGFLGCNENEKPGIYINVAFYFNFINGVLIGIRSRSMHVIQLTFRNEVFEFQRIVM